MTDDAIEFVDANGYIGFWQIMRSSYRAPEPTEGDKFLLRKLEEAVKPTEACRHSRGSELPEKAQIQIPTPGTLWRGAGAVLVPEETSTVFEYVRRVNPLDDGPTWIYVPADPDYKDPWRPIP